MAQRQSPGTPVNRGSQHQCTKLETTLEHTQYTRTATEYIQYLRNLAMFHSPLLVQH